MKKLFLGFLLLNSLSAVADEWCQVRFGMNHYYFQADRGALEASDGSKFQLVYWKDSELSVVKDAKITILKSILFHQEEVDASNQMSPGWVSLVTDYATRLKVETSSTEIDPAVKEVTLSTICTSSVYKKL